MYVSLTFYVACPELSRAAASTRLDFVRRKAFATEALLGYSLVLLGGC
jgi:hypothetical protein